MASHCGADPTPMKCRNQANSGPKEGGPGTLTFHKPILHAAKIHSRYSVVESESQQRALVSPWPAVSVRSLQRL